MKGFSSRQVPYMVLLLALELVLKLMIFNLNQLLVRALRIGVFQLNFFL